MATREDQVASGRLRLLRLLAMSRITDSAGILAVRPLLPAKRRSGGATANDVDGFEAARRGDQPRIGIVGHRRPAQPLPQSPKRRPVQRLFGKFELPIRRISVANIASPLGSGRQSALSARAPVRIVVVAHQVSPVRTSSGDDTLISIRIAIRVADQRRHPVRRITGKPIPVDTVSQMMAAILPSGVVPSSDWT